MLERLPCSARPTATPADPNSATMDVPLTPRRSTAIKITMQRNAILRKEQLNVITPKSTSLFSIPFRNSDTSHLLSLKPTPIMIRATNIFKAKSKI